MMRGLIRGVVVAVASCGLAACTREPGDAVCRSEGGEQSGLRVTGATDAYFYAHDRGGHQVGYERLGRVLALQPGEYDAAVNGTRRRVTVRSGAVTTCTAGEVRVAGTTDAYYYVLDTLGTQLAYERLGRYLTLLPGRYALKLNSGQTRVVVPAGDTVEVAAGTVVVDGPTDEYYYVLDTLGRQLAYNRLGAPLAFFPGRYVVKLNNATAGADVRAAEVTTLRAGALVAHGSTDAYYYVLDSSAAQLGYARLGTITAYLPGHYRLRVTAVDTAVSVRAGESTQVATGTLVVNGRGAEYYYVDDGAGRQLHYARLGAPTSLLAGTYRVRVAARSAEAAVVPGQTTAVSP